MDIIPNNNNNDNNDNNDNNSHNNNDIPIIGDDCVCLCLYNCCFMTDFLLEILRVA